VCGCGEELGAGPPPNELVTGRKGELVAEGWRLVREIAGALKRGPEAILAAGSTGRGTWAGKPLTRLETASDDRLLRTVLDLRKWRAELVRDGVIRSPPELVPVAEAPPDPTWPAATDALERILGALESGVPAQSFATWFRPLQAVAMRDGALLVRVPSAQWLSWITGFRERIDAAMAAAGLSETRLQLVVADDTRSMSA
jgi:hypothetical protein